MFKRIKECVIRNKKKILLTSGISVFGLGSIAGMVIAAPSASAALYVTGMGGVGSAQLTANFNGGTSCVKDTSNNSYVSLVAYDSSNRVMWSIQDNSNNGVAVCAYTQGGVHHLIAYLNSNPATAPMWTKTWRANRPSSSWFLNSCYPRC